MKELQAEIKDSDRNSRTLTPSLPVLASEPVGSVIGAIEPLQPQLEREAQRQRVVGWQRLAAQAERINQLSAELETAMFEFKAIANVVKRDRRILQASQEPFPNICEYLAAMVPYVGYKQNGSFVLTTRPVDLFRAERDAALIAQALRSRVKGKLALPPTGKIGRRRVLSSTDLGISQ